MSSAIRFHLSFAHAHSQTVLRADSERLSLYVAEMPGCSPPETSVLIENVNRTWFVAFLTDDISAWHWHEVRNVIVDYATQYAFMHPEVFQDFLEAFDMMAPEDSWSPISTVTSRTEKLHPLLLQWNAAPFFLENSRSE